MYSFSPPDHYTKGDLRRLIDLLKSGDSLAVRELIAFAMFESKGLWHGRARAKICRYLRNHPPDKMLQDKLVAVVADRLRNGNFGQQFHDQLKMAIRFDANTIRAAAESTLKAPKRYVRRNATWVIAYLNGLRRERIHDA